MRNVLKDNIVIVIVTSFHGIVNVEIFIRFPYL